MTESATTDLVLDIQDDEFDTEVLNSETPVLVDFWAEWCGPCKMLAPLLEEVASSYEGKLKVVKVNVDQNRATASRFAVRGLPTLMLFKNGEVETTKVGAMSKSQIEALIDSSI